MSFKANNTIISTPKQPVSNLDEIPFPALNLVNLSLYNNGYKNAIHKNSPICGILPTRGCSLNCNFCSLALLYGQLFRTHTIERIINELLCMRDEFGVREVHFYDENLINNENFAKKLFKAIIDNKINMSWLAEAGFAIWKTDEEILELAIASGMYRLDLPIETASKRVRNNIMGKELYDNSNVISIIKSARKFGIEKIMGFIIIGNPGETIEDIKLSLDFIASLDLDYRGVRFAQPFPGTQFYNICFTKGYLSDGFNLDRLWFNIPNIQTEDFNISEIASLESSYRAVALIKKGKLTLNQAIEEIKLKYNKEISQKAGVIIGEILKNYEEKQF